MCVGWLTWIGGRVDEDDFQVALQKDERTWAARRQKEEEGQWSRKRGRRTAEEKAAEKEELESTLREGRTYSFRDLGESTQTKEARAKRRSRQLLRLIKEKRLPAGLASELRFERPAVWERLLTQRDEPTLTELQKLAGNLNPSRKVRRIPWSSDEEAEYRR
jgi:hypothetical protein